MDTKVLQTLNKLEKRPGRLDKGDINLLLLTPGLLGKVQATWLAPSSTNTPPEILQLLSQHPSYDVRRVVASNPATPMKALVELREEPSMAHTVVNNPAWEVREEDLIHLASQNIYKLRPHQRLALIKQNPNITIRIAQGNELGFLLLEEQLLLAQRCLPNPPQKALELLHDFGYLGALGSRLAANPNCHPEVVKLLAPKFPTYAYQNPHCPLEVFLLLAKGSRSVIKFKMAQNPKTPREVLEVLSQDQNLRLRLIALQTLQAQQTLHYGQ